MRRLILTATLFITGFSLNTASAVGISQLEKIERFAQAGAPSTGLSGLQGAGTGAASGVAGAPGSGTGLQGLQTQSGAQNTEGQLELNGKTVQELEEGLSKSQSKAEEKNQAQFISATAEFSSVENDFYARTRSLHIKLRQFGYDFFSGKPRLSLSIPVDSSYVLGPGDELFLYVIGAPPGIDLTKVTRLVVDRQGKIYIPGLGVFYVWGMTLGEAERMISQALGANIKLTVGRLRTFPVYVSGEVRRPGAVVVTGVNTVIDAIMLAGGIKKSGTLRDVVVTRKTPKGIKRIHIDFYRLLLDGKPVDMRLKDGDVIFVKPIGKVAGIGGRVKRPAIYEITGKETLKDLIKMAGGLLPSSYKYKVILQRYVNNQLLEVKQGSLDDEKFMSQKVHDGDILIIKQVISVPQNAVAVEGYTPYPGLYEYKPGMKLSQLLTPDFFFSDSNMKFGLIERHYPPGALPKYITFSPESVLSGEEDLELKPQDRIILYKFGTVEGVDFNKVKDAFIVEGKIKYPGVYAYRKGMKLSDILTPDLITENTNLDYAEIDRRDPDTLEIKKIIQFSPEAVLKHRTNLEIHRLDTIRFFPRYAYKPIRVSGDIEVPYKVPYHPGIKLSEALSYAKFKSDIRNLKVLIFRKKEKSSMAVRQEKEQESFTSNTPNSYRINYNLNKGFRKRFSTFISNSERDTSIGEGREIKSSLNRTVPNVSEGNQNSFENTVRSSFLFKKSKLMNVASFFLYDVLVKQKESSFELLPGDKLVIVRVKPEEAVEKVRVSGYVRHPGVYSIGEKTTLYDILKKAGGFLPNAYPKGIIILRKSVAELQKQRLQKAIALMRQQLEKEEAGIMQSDLTPAELQARQAAFEAKRRLLKELQKSQVTGRISGISVPRDLEKLKNSPYNIVLEDGDQIFVPKVPGSVLVFGEVYNPSALVYVKGMTVRDYINEAGGLTKDADKENIFVIKANGSVVSSENVGEKKFDWNSETNRIVLGKNDIMDYRLEPGDSVIVPTKVHVPVMWRPLIKDVMQIIYQGAITIYTITKL